MEGYWHNKSDWLMKELGAPIQLAAMPVSLKLGYSRTYWPKSPLFEGK